MLFTMSTTVLLLLCNFHDWETNTSLTFPAFCVVLEKLFNSDRQPVNFCIPLYKLAYAVVMHANAQCHVTFTQKSKTRVTVTLSYPFYPTDVGKSQLIHLNSLLITKWRSLLTTV